MYILILQNVKIYSNSVLFYIKQLSDCYLKKQIASLFILVLLIMLFIDLENNSNDKTMTNSNTSYIENDKVSILVLRTLIMPVIT